METTARIQYTPIWHYALYKRGASLMLRLIITLRRGPVRSELMRLGEHQLRDIGRDRDEALREARRRYLGGRVSW